MDLRASQRPVRSSLHASLRGARWRCLAWCLCALPVLGACANGGAAGEGADWPRIELQRVFGELRFQQPLAMLQAPGDERSWYVVEQAGQVQRIVQNDGGIERQLFVDIRERVQFGGERGLLGMAFHPRQPQGGVFLSYTGTDERGGLRSYVSRFALRADGRGLDPASEQVVLSVAQPYGNHNGGNIAFGPDGYLYIGFGDGGSAGDPLGHAQNLQTLLGAMLRIDVDAGDPYAVPADNPLAGGEGRPEIFAWGLRNPWRWSFDRESGALWVGDVGQDAWEEIDVVVKGGNYGWNHREGRHCFRSNPCRSEGLIDPVAEYSHREGNSVTGGYVYRGSRIGPLRGAYLYGDFGSGRIWGLRLAKARGPGPQLLIRGSGVNISSFAEGHDGELYVLDYFAGRIFRIVPATS